VVHAAAVADAESDAEGTGSYQIHTDRGLVRPRLALATGGLSIPKIGATDFGYRLAQQFSCR
jgi:predicted flavoprotein YhiN